MNCWATGAKEAVGIKLTEIFSSLLNGEAVEALATVPKLIVK